MLFQKFIRKIKLEEYQKLRNTTDWPNFDDQIVRKALTNDLFSICIESNSKTIGIGRVIGDGALYYYIQDVIVHPDFQKKGIGKIIMDEIEIFLTQNAPKGAFIGLMAAKNVESFYLQFGYQKRAFDAPGMFKLIEG